VNGITAVVAVALTHNQNDAKIFCLMFRATKPPFGRLLEWLVPSYERPDGEDNGLVAVRTSGKVCLPNTEQSNQKEFMSDAASATSIGTSASQNITIEQQNLAIHEIAIKRKELEVRNREADKAIALANAPWWRRADPLVLAILAAAVTMAGNMIVAVYNSNATISQEETKGGNTLMQEKEKAANDLALEKQKARYTLILQAIATTDPKTADRNINFFIDSGLLQDADNKIRDALAKYNPVLPAATPTQVTKIQTLPSLNASIAESSISGVSSGAFMAVQFATVWSSIVKGVGVVSGGPYYCAQASVWNATGPCTIGPPPDLKSLVAKVDQSAKVGDIDATRNLGHQKIYLFHGYNDVVMARSVTDRTAEFYRHYLGDSAGGNLFYQTAISAGHALVVNRPNSHGLNNCAATESPFINQCGYDQAGIILEHTYGALNPPNAGELTGTVLSFDQQPYTNPFGTAAISLADTGYVFVPKDCQDGAPCRVHVALHGCRQGLGEINRRFVDDAGYNAWADTNHIIVLYPQTRPSAFLPMNPMGCWDWWNYATHEGSPPDVYVTKSGPQISAIMAMLNALTAGVKGAAPPPAALGVAPAQLVVADTSDTGAALAWTPIAGADAYRVFRAGSGGSFAPVGSVAGPSFGDRGLSPGSSYRWRVSAIVSGVEGPPSAEVVATTRKAPSCDHPGTCP
jgi:poly(3-hydroxybutyrate) depolymerase